ncbi:MAG: ABC transporter substrate-binding protein [Bdellovibrionales bacterium]|nr:ABC transporter substrate-binding protein [Bdellovibrionales bacterium]
MMRFFLTLFIALFCYLSCLHAQEQTIALGGIFGLSGSAARYGEWGNRGVQLAIEEINQQGGIRGRQLKVYIEDDQSSPAKAITAYKKLTSLHDVSFFLTMQSSVALALSPHSNRDKNVQIDFTATTPSYSSPDDYTFRTGVLATQLAEDIAQYMYKTSGVKETGCLYIENDYGAGMLQAFKKYYKGKILFEEPFREGESDYRAYLLKLKSKNIRDIWLIGHLREDGVIVRQAHELGMALRFFTDVYSVEGPDFLDIAGEVAQNIFYVAPTFHGNKGGTVAEHLAQLYRNRFGEDATYLVAQAYDAVYAFAHALKACDELSPTCVKDQLYKTEFEGASGTITFDRNGDTKKELTIKEL